MIDDKMGEKNFQYKSPAIPVNHKGEIIVPSISVILL